MQPLQRPPILALLLLPLLAGCGAAGEERAADAVADVEQYRQQRLESLRASDSWLTLVGLTWLREGDNAFGSDTAGAVVLPADKAPPYLGTFTLAAGRVRVRMAPGAGVTHEGVPVDTLTLASDATLEPTILDYGSLSWYVIDRDGRLGIRLKDSESPALAAFTGIDTYPLDLAWRLQGRFDRYDPPRKVPIPNILGGAIEETVPGAVAFDVGGRTYRLDVTGEPADTAFFVIFGDPTNGKQTYSGGRYLWVDAPDAAGRLTIDFNKAYNPPCVFTPYATCPLPPPQNRLSLAVEAGEKTYGVH